MKKFISLSAFLFFIGFSSIVHAQATDSTVGQKVKSDLKTTGHEFKKSAKKVGHKTAKVASEAKSTIVDKTYADKVGPDGQVVYIDKHAKLYYIDDKGHKKFVTKKDLKDKNG